MFYLMKPRTTTCLCDAPEKVTVKKEHQNIVFCFKSPIRVFCNG